MANSESCSQYLYCNTIHNTAIPLLIETKSHSDILALTIQFANSYLICIFRTEQKQQITSKNRTRNDSLFLTFN